MRRTGPVVTVPLHASHVIQKQCGILFIGDDFDIRHAPEALGVKQTAAPQLGSFHHQFIQLGVFTFHPILLGVGLPGVNPHAAGHQNQGAHTIDDSAKQGFGLVHGSGHFPGVFSPGRGLDASRSRQRRAGRRRRGCRRNRPGGRSGHGGRSRRRAQGRF